MVFELQVADSYGGSDSDTVSVRVVAGNNGPSANAGPDDAVDEGLMNTLTCVGSDPDGDHLIIFLDSNIWPNSRDCWSNQYTNPYLCSTRSGSGYSNRI